MEILIVFCTVAIIWAMLSIADNTPERRRERAEQAQISRECEAAARWAAARAARTPEQVAADIELDVAQCGVSEFREGDYNPDWMRDVDFGYDRAAHAAESRARLTRAIEGRRAAFATPPKLTEKQGPAKVALFARKGSTTLLSASWGALLLCPLFKLEGALPDVVVVAGASYILFCAARFGWRKAVVLRHVLLELYRTGGWTVTK